MGALGFAASGGLFPQSGFDIGWSIGPFDFGLGSVFNQPWGSIGIQLPGGIPDFGIPDWSVISEIPTIPTPVRPPPDEGEVVAHDWGHLGRELLGGIAQQAFFAPEPVFVPSTLVTPPSEAFGGTVQRTSPAAVPAALVNECGLDGQVWGGQAPPKGYKVVNYCGVATLRKIRRRRRRRMLSTSDKNDIASIVSMVGKGQMASALINRTSP